ncbi:MAG: hypothetical protein K0Q95_2392 [Bacteroidota bacterium]|jgi:hypothetical protein|nr:hypothetical protein [Bacteroidota bacterium]
MNFTKFNYCFLIAAVFFISSLKSQNIQGKGTAVIFFEPAASATVIVDSVKINQSRNPIQMTEGKHFVSASAPNKKTFRDTIKIIEGKTSILVKKLEYTNEYAAYLKSMNMYRLKKTGAYFVILPATVIYGWVAYSKHSQNKKEIAKYYDKALESQAKFENSVSTANLNFYKSEYEQNKEKYETYLATNNRIAKSARIIIPAGIVASAALIWLGTKIKKPELSNHPVSFNSLSLSRDESVLCFNLSLNINCR